MRDGVVASHDTVGDKKIHQEGDEVLAFYSVGLENSSTRSVDQRAAVLGFLVWNAWAERVAQTSPVSTLNATSRIL